MKDTPVLTREAAKDLLHILLQGWADNSNTENSDLDQLFRRYTGGDQELASMLSLMSYWSNDLMSHAAGLGLTLEMKDELWVVVEVPPMPEGKFYWECGELRWTGEAYEYDPGKWEPIPDEIVDASKGEKL